MYPFADAARSPHGDSNLTVIILSPLIPDAARSPHGDSNDICQVLLVERQRCSPHPSRGQQRYRPASVPRPHWRCSPHPSRGQQRFRFDQLGQRLQDAARTPHGDSISTSCIQNSRRQLDAARAPHGDSNIRNPMVLLSPAAMQPAPLTGTATEAACCRS